MSNAALSPYELEFLQGFFKKHSGYHLGHGKEYLLTSCLQPVLARHKIATLSDMVKRLQDPTQKTFAQECVEGMTVNETMFFRDKTPFEQLEHNILPELFARKKRINIWCTACSSGQEPYSVAMLILSLRDRFPATGFHILATDIASDMVQRGKDGIYSDIEVKRSLPPQMRDTFMTQHGNQWRMNDVVRSTITFAVHNALEPAPKGKKFDLVLCRNVLIYFDRPHKAQALHNIYAAMNNPAYLLAGASEILTGLCDGIKAHPEWRSVYMTTDPTRS